MLVQNLILFLSCKPVYHYFGIVLGIINLMKHPSTKYLCARVGKGHHDGKLSRPLLIYFRASDCWKFVPGIQSGTFRMTNIMSAINFKQTEFGFIASTIGFIALQYLVDYVPCSLANFYRIVIFFASM